MKKMLLIPLLFCLFFMGPLFMGPPSLRGADAISSSKKDLRMALRHRDEKATVKAIRELVSVGGKQSISVFLKILLRFPRGEERLYWMLLQGATSYHDTGALTELAHFIIAKKNTGVSRDLLFALAQNSSVEVLVVLKEVLKKGPYDLQLMAVDQISNIKHPSSVDALLDAWKVIRKKSGHETLVKRISQSLSALTGQTMGTMYENWQGWWSQNRRNGLKGGSGDSEKTTGTVIDRLGKNRRSEYEELKKLPKERILVIKGTPCKVKGVDHNFDHIEDTLDSLGIPHTVVTKREFNDKNFSLKGRMMILINCSLSWEHCACPTCKAGGSTVQRLQQCTGCDKHDIVTDKISPDGVKKLQYFAAAGGYLFTEDWVLVEVLEKAWPGLVRKGDPTREEMTVNVLPGRFHGSHSYLRGIFGFKKKEESSGGGKAGRSTVLRGLDEALEKIKHTWKVDRESPSIKIVSPYKVSKIMASPELAKQMKGNDCVAVTFSVVGGNRRPTTGRKMGEVSEMRGGRVLHVISHFGHQKSTEDEFTLQNLMINFILEAKQRWDWRK